MLDGDRYEIPETLEGVRLDKALAVILPEASLRHRRRLCEDGAVLVNGANRRPGYKVKEGQEIELLRETGDSRAIMNKLIIVEQTNDFAAVLKPAGMHTAAIVGREAPSVEAALKPLFGGQSPTLLNRLDFLTSGLTLVALNSDAVVVYQRLEKQGVIKKFYRAEVQGRFDGVAVVENRLDTDNRIKTRVLDESDPDPRRWTTVETRAHDHERDTTTVRCLIAKGARHQIRAHLASIGHPIVGDPLYGDAVDGERLKLHHERIEFEGFSARAEADF